MSKLDVLAVIPARYPSQRLPGKPLADIAGKPLVQWVYEAARDSRLFSSVVVATDDPRILDAVERFGGQAKMTSDQHQTGTDRVAEVAGMFPDSKVIVNVQGDQPFITGEILAALVEPFRSDATLAMSTVACPMPPAGRNDPGCVKVALDQHGYALFFTRASIPVFRTMVDVPVYQHLGLYAFSRDFLLKYSELAPTPFEKAEQLEQLRVLENGYRIRLSVVPSHIPEVNTPEDLEIARDLMTSRMQQR